MKPCSDCPFMKSSPLQGAPEWLKDVMDIGLLHPSIRHSCHKTDPVADGFNGRAKKTRECSGHIRMMMNEMDKTPGRDGVYKSLQELAETYLRKWLGNDGFEAVAYSVSGDLTRVRMLK